MLFLILSFKHFVKGRFVSSNPSDLISINNCRIARRTSESSPNPVALQGSYSRNDKLTLSSVSTLRCLATTWVRLVYSHVNGE